MRNTKRVVWTGFLGVVAAGCTSPPRSSDSPPRISAETSSPTRIEALSQGCWEEGVLSWRQADFVQQYVLNSGGELVVIDDALDGATGEWTKTAHATEVAFDPFVSASAGRDWFVIGGLDRATNEMVIERLELASNVSSPASPPAKAFSRLEIYRGPLSKTLVALGADPNKRFLLLLTDPSPARRLYQIPMQPNATPVLLYDAVAQPVLAQAWMLNLLQHVALGRIWLVSGMTDTFTGETMVLVDTDNDGIFEPSPRVGLHEELVASGLLDSSQILDSFVGP
jgi:hypothetical protein